MKKLFIETYGCQMNVADSEVVASVMGMAGYEPTESIDEADAVFLNTCSVRDNAEQKIYHRLEALVAERRKRGQFIIGVLGCMAERVADERGVWTVGCAYDNSGLFPDTWLTGCVFNWEPLLTSLVQEWRQGRFIGQRYQGGISSGLVSITPLPDQISAGIRSLTASETQRLAEGKYDVFFGPVRDVYGTVQVRQDENMSDEKILRGMYWFVDGVVLE